MYLREAHHIFQQTHRYISFTVFCKLQPVNVLLLGDSPKDQCKCMTHENFFLKLEALDIEYTSYYWNSILCDATLNSDCWCEKCKDGKKIVVVDEEKYVNYKKWMEVMIPRNQNENENEVDRKKEKEYYKVLQIHSDRVQQGSVLDELKSEMRKILHHIIQNRFKPQNLTKTRPILQNECSR